MKSPYGAYCVMHCESGRTLLPMTNYDWYGDNSRLP